MSHETTGPPRADLTGAVRHLAAAVDQLDVWHHGGGDRVHAGHAARRAMAAAAAALDAARRAHDVELEDVEVDLLARLAASADRWDAAAAGVAGGGWSADREDPEMDATADPKTVEGRPLGGRNGGAR